MLNRATVILLFCITVIVRAYFFGVTTIPWWIGMIFLLLVKDTRVVRVQEYDQEKIDELADMLLRDAEKGMEDEDGR